MKLAYFLIVIACYFLANVGYTLATMCWECETISPLGLVGYSLITIMLPGYFGIRRLKKHRLKSELGTKSEPME